VLMWLDFPRPNVEELDRGGVYIEVSKASVLRSLSDFPDHAICTAHFSPHNNKLTIG